MFANLKAALRAIATNERSYSLRAMSPDTICPGYDFDADNPTWGQCGLVREATCTHLYLFTLHAIHLANAEIHGLTGDYFGQPMHLPPSFFQNGSSPDMLFLRHWRELLGDWEIVCAYGGGTLHTGKEFRDHCWTQIAPPDRIGDPKAGIFVDSTLDQFGPVPKIIVQKADATDGPVVYKPEKLEIFGTHDATSRRTQERFDLYMAEMRGDPRRFWGGEIDLLAGYRLAA